MKNIIQVLEQMGQDAALQNEQAVAEFIEQAELGKELQTSLIEQDTVTLERQLDVRKDIVCMIDTPEEDIPTEAPEEEPQPEQNSEAKTVING